MSASAPSGSAARWRAVKLLPGRVPLHTKLISAVLALVIIALAVISFASINLFRDYQIRHASQQVTALFDQQLAQVNQGTGGPPNMLIYAGFFLIAMRPVGATLHASAGASIPDIPTSQAWLSANSGKLVNVPAVSGTDTWRAITPHVRYQRFGPFSTQQIPR